jgi:hypothetical protein
MLPAREKIVMRKPWASDHPALHRAVTSSRSSCSYIAFTTGILDKSQSQFTSPLSRDKIDRLANGELWHNEIDQL